MNIVWFWQIAIGLSHALFLADVICDGVQSFYFEKEMSAGYNKTECKCLPNCEEVRFSMNQIKYKVDEALECDANVDVGYITRNPDITKPYNIPTLLREQIK